MPGILNRVKNILLFKEPAKNENFILKEPVNEGGDKNADLPGKDKGGGRESGKVGAKGYIKYRERLSNKHAGKSDRDGGKADGKAFGGEDNFKVSKKLAENLDYIKKRYTIPLNSDVMLREFDIVVKGKAIPAFMIFYDGMVDRKVIDDDILKSLMLLSNLDIRSDERDTAEFIQGHLLTHNQLKQENEIEKVIDEVNFGECAVFVDGVDIAFVMDVKGWEHRAVERPNTELVIRGPQEGFTELMRANTALIRKMLKDEDLIAEGVELGRRSKTPSVILYIKNIANDSLVKEVRKRVKNISVDYLIDSGELEQLIEDSSVLPAPQILATERRTGWPPC